MIDMDLLLDVTATGSVSGTEVTFFYCNFIHTGIIDGSGDNMSGILQATNAYYSAEGNMP